MKPSETEASWAAPSTIVGQRVPRIDAFEKVVGAAGYMADMKLPNMLYGKALRSTFPHAKLLHIDTSKAKRLPGVRAVVTGRDVPFYHGPDWLIDQPLLAIDKVRYAGEAVAAVAATTEETAAEALELIEVEYEELPPVFDPLEAMQPTAPLIHEDMERYQQNSAVTKPVPGTNICSRFVLKRGDVDEGFAKSDRVFADSFTSQMVQHCCLEPHASIALVDAGNTVTMWTGTQSPYRVRRAIAQALGLPMSKVRVIVPYIGGGFGSKEYLSSEAIGLALALKSPGVPVKVLFSRAEEFTSGRVRHPCVIHIRTGVKSDGTLVAREMELIWDTGAYGDFGPLVCRNASSQACGPYLIPHLKINSYCVYTNKPIAGAFRGFGAAQAAWAYESHLDIIARELGLDSVDIRLKNGVDEGDISQTGQVLYGVGLKGCLRSAADAMDWGKRKGEAGQGRGIASIHRGTASPSASSAFVKVGEDGSVEVLTSTTEIGQGAYTVLAQVVAEELGAKLEQVTVSKADTAYTPFDQSTTSSRSTFHMGNAVRLAAADAKRKLLEIASSMLEIPPEELRAGEGRIFLESRPELGVTFAEAMTSRYSYRGGPVLGVGEYELKDVPVDGATGQGTYPSAFWMYAAQGAEVEVDRETGIVDVKRLVAAHDVGRAINPANCEQQIEGALLTGMGCALSEEMLFADGIVQNASFLDYRLPTARQTPAMQSILVETYHREGPFGAKGLGEPALAPTAAAIANAIYDAVGVRLKDLPLSAERVLKALKEKRPKG